MGLAERGTCSVCRRTVACRLPKGGDGSAVFPLRHKPRGEADWPRRLEPAEPWCAGQHLPAE